MTAIPSSAAKLVDGELYLRTAFHGESVRYEEILRLSDDAPLFVLRATHGCGSSMMRFDSPFLLNATLDSREGAVTKWIARYDLTTGKLEQTTVLDMLPPSTSWFTFDDGWGMAGGATVQIAIEPATSPETVFTAIGFLLDARARDGMAVWADAGFGKTNIRTWTEGSGHVSLFEDEGVVAGLALGEERIAWVAGKGPNAAFGGYDVATILWSPVAAEPSGFVAHPIMDVSGKVAGPLAVATAGDYVAASNGGTGEVTAGPGTFVHRVSTNESWFIPARPGTRIELLGMSDTEIVITEAETNTGGFERILRLSLDSLDSLALGWGP